jgi:hypothetical protein
VSTTHAEAQSRVCEIPLTERRQSCRTSIPLDSSTVSSENGHTRWDNGTLSSSEEDVLSIARLALSRPLCNNQIGVDLLTFGLLLDEGSDEGSTVVCFNGFVIKRVSHFQTEPRFGHIG